MMTRRLTNYTRTRTSFASELALDLQWMTFPTVLGSEHYPVMMTLLTPEMGVTHDYEILNIKKCKLCHYRKIVTGVTWKKYLREHRKQSRNYMDFCNWPWRNIALDIRKGKFTGEF